MPVNHASFRSATARRLRSSKTAQVWPGGSLALAALANNSADPSNRKLCSFGCPWPWGLVDFVARVAAARSRHRPRDHFFAALHRAAGPRRWCASRRREAPRHPVHARRRVLDLRREFARSAGHRAVALRRLPVLVVNYRMIPKHSDRRGDRRLLRRLRVAAADGLRAGSDRAGGRLRRRLPRAGAGREAAARRLQESPAAMVSLSPLFADRQRNPRQPPEHSHPMRCSRPRLFTHWSTSSRRRPHAASSTASPKRSTNRSTTSSRACRAR